MAILQMLESEHSKKQTNDVVNFIGKDQKKFDELFSLFMKGGAEIVQRAAWPLSYAAIANPGFISNHYKDLFIKLRDTKQHDAVHRNIMKMFSEIESYPEKYHGILMDQCLAFVEEPKAKSSLQAYSLKVLSKLCKHYPEIIPEVKMIIDERIENAKGAYCAAARHFLKSVKKISP